MSTIICARFHFFLTQRFRSSKLNKKETYEQSMDELDLQTLSAWAEDMYDFVMTIMDHMKTPMTTVPASF